MKKIYSSSNFVNFANFAKFATGSFARIAAMLLMLITMSVGQLWAATDYITVYFCPGAVGKSWNSPYVNYCPGDNAWFNQAMTNTGKTYNGNAIFSHVLERRYGGFDKVEFHASQNNWDGSIAPINGWSTTDISGKMWVGSWIDYTFDAPETLYTITVVNGTPTSVDAGTRTKPTITANAAAQDYSFTQWNATAGVTVTNSTNASTTVSATQDGTVTATYSLDECNLQYAEGTGTSYTAAMSSSKVMSYDSEEKAYYVDVTTTNTSFYFRFKKTKEGAVYAADWDSYPNGTRVDANGAKVNANKDVSSWGDKSICYYKANESGHAIRIWFDYANKQTWITLPCVSGAGFNIAQPGNGKVGDSFNMNPNIPGGVVGATVSYVCSPAGAVSFDGNTATYLTAADPVSITATLSGSNLCAPVEHTTNNFMIAATSTYSLSVSAGANIASVTGGKADQASVPFNSEISATPATGYDFAGWTASPAANATFGNAASASTTVTVKNGSVTVTATAAIKSYTISYTANEDVTSYTSQVTNPNYNQNVTVTPVAKSGYVVTNIKVTKTGDAPTIVANVNATTCQFTQPAYDVTVTVTTEKEPAHTVYLFGRFTIKDEGGNQVHTGANAGSWVSSNSSNIVFTYDEVNDEYVINTRMTAREIAAEQATEHYIWPYDATDSKHFLASTDKLEVPYESAPSSNGSLSSYDGNHFQFPTNGGQGIDIILHYKQSENKFWYTSTAETKYTITLTDATESSVEVGNVTPVSITAADKSGYIFTGWTADNANVTFADASAKTTTITATGTATVTATYREAGSTKIYFYNDKDWATVKVHKWGGSETGTDWPGVAADLESITHDGHTIYSVTVTEGEYANIIFNAGESGDYKQINTTAVNDWTEAAPCLRHTDKQGHEWIALPTQNYQIVYGSKLSVTNSYASGSYVDEGAELTFTAATPDAGYTFAGFFSDGDKTQEITGAGVDMENRTYTVTLNSNIEVHAKYTENLYTVTVSAGEHGSVSPSGEQQVGVVGIDLTATPDAHYYFENWTTTGGAAMEGNHLTATDAGTVTANFTPSWSVRGDFNSWAVGNYIEHYEGNIGYVDIEFAVGTYEFKVFHHNGGAYGNTGTMTRENCSGWTMATDKGNCRITTDKAGVYRFTFDIDTKKLTVTYPAPDASLSIEKTAGADYVGQKIIITPTTNQLGEVTICYNFDSKPAGSEVTFTPEGKNVYFIPDVAGQYTISATLHRDGCGSETIVAASPIDINIAANTYRIYVGYNGVSQGHFEYDNGYAIDLEEGKEYEVKVIDATNPGSLVWYGNKGTMTATNCTGWTFSSSVSENAGLATTIAGTYNFYFDIATKKLSVTYPEIAGGKEMYSKAVKDANTDVMIQAFYWAHEGNTATDYEPFGSVKWADLDGKELGENFDLVWLAPSTVTADYTGYLPMNYAYQGTITAAEATASGREVLDWTTYHSPWGSESELKTLISNIHTGGGKAVADIVINHSNAGNGSWCDWGTIPFGQYGSFTPNGDWITYNDEMFLYKNQNQYGQREQAGDCGADDVRSGNPTDDYYVSRWNGSAFTSYSWDYTEYNCTYSRDWAHGLRDVREMSRAYLLWMKNEIGYDGWRYDFGKGFHGKYVNDYNHASGAYFSVAELFEGDVNKLEGYLKDANYDTYVFDFPGKYNLMNNAIKNGWYQGLRGSETNTMTYGNIKQSSVRRSRYTVTFVDNHDTFREGYNLSGHANQMPNLGNQVLQAHAYILSMPGVPCVFYPYWHEFKEEIKAMVWARKWTGVNSESNVTNEEAADGKYLAVIHGTNGSIWLKLGPNAGVDVCPSGYQCAYTGTNVGVYYKVTDASLVKPMISCDKESQEFVGSIPVTFTAKGANVAYTIYYTINGGAEQTVASGTPITIGATAAVDDVITVTAYAKSEGGIPSNTLTYTYTKKADKITLTAVPTAATVGSTVELTPTAQSGATYGYHFFVKEPGASNFMSCGFTENGAALNYVMAGEGYYQFYVTTTNTDPIYTSNTVRVNAEALVYHLRYKKTDESEWANVTMSPNGDGTYVYYDADARADISNGANVGLNGTDSDPFFNSEKIANPDNAHDGDNVVWVYNAFEQTLKVNNPGYHVYRIKVTLTDGRDFYSNIIYQTGNAVDVSFYAQIDAELSLERYGKNNENKFAWEEIGSIVMPSIANNGVYTSTATVTVTAAHDEIPEVTSCTLAEPLTAYDEPYYITTPGQPAPGSQPTKPNYEMTKFDGSHTYYNHYYVAWMQGGQNTYGTVGNTINKNLAGAVGYYVLTGDEYQGANVRYAYNPATNVFTRTHLAGSTSVGYLTAFGTNVQDTTEAHNALTSAVNGQTLADVSNWMYATAIRIDQTAVGKASALKLAAQYNGAYTYLLAADGLDSETAKRDLTEADNTLGEYPQFGVIYDYKENRILSGWNPEGAVINDRKEVSNVIIRRVNDGATSQFTINSGEVLVTDKMITELVITKKMYEDWGGYADDYVGYKTMFFWFSLPYECQLWNVYGFAGAYKVQTAVDAASWEVQRYRGDLRANGTAGSSAWKRLSEFATTEANRGYVLAVKISAADFNAITIDDKTTSEIRFFFQSAASVTLRSTASTVLPANSGTAAEIQQGWNVMGVPVMKSNCGFEQTATTKFEYAYRWTWADGGRWYEPFAILDGTAGVGNEKHFNFESGHAYMVQVKDETTLNWNYTELAGSAWAPVRARVASNMLTDRNFRVDLYYSDEMQDKTYVKYRTNGTRDYERGRDLEKIENAGRSMIYSELQDKLAAICLADTDHVQIPLTVVASESGEYVLRLPAAVDGVEPVLYDAQEGVTTMLNYDEYVINLPADTYKDRFFLRMEAKSPSITTSVENVGTEGDKVIKFIDNNNQLMILRDGHLYDAQGHMVR